MNAEVSRTMVEKNSVDGKWWMVTHTGRVMKLQDPTTLTGAAWLELTEEEYSRLKNQAGNENEFAQKIVAWALRNRLDIPLLK